MRGWDCSREAKSKGQRAEGKKQKTKVIRNEVENREAKRRETQDTRHETLPYTFCLTFAFLILVSCFLFL
jgi:hypothetical protein